MPRLFIVVLAFICLSGCAANYEAESLSAPATMLDRTAVSYVAVPENGIYGTTVYPHSGQDTARAMFEAISVRSSHAILADAHQTHAVNLEKAKAVKARYLFEAEILHWEDRATEWSGLPDRLTLKVTTYDVATGKVLGAATLTSHSTWWTLGGDHPQDLLPKTLKPFFDRAYGTKNN